jgi:PAS domain S-box-containing protein
MNHTIEIHKTAELPELFESLVYSLSDVVFTVDKEMRYTGVYGDWVEKFGLTQEYFIGKSVREIFSDDEADLHEQMINKSFRGEKVSYEWCTETEQERLCFQTVLSPVYDGRSREIIGLMGISRNITVQKTLEQQLREYNETLTKTIERESTLRIKAYQIYRAIFDLSPEGLLIMDRHGAINQMNRAASAITGFELKEVYGKNLLSFSPPKQTDSELPSKEVFEDILHYLTDGEIQHVSWSIRRKDGKLINVQLLFSLLGGQEHEILCIMRDDSLIQQLQKEKENQKNLLIQQSRLAELGGMIGSLIHSWRQPLQAIAMTAQYLPDAFQFGELNQESINKIVYDIMKQVDDLSSSLDKFRNIFKSESKAVTMNPRDELYKVWDIIEDQMKSIGVHLNVECDNEYNLEGFPGEFRQILMNLLNNSKKAFETNKIKSPEIKVTFKTSGTDLIISYEDNGGGFPESLLPDKLFEPYYTSEVGASTGIGLSISRSIIEAKMHGSVTAYNDDDKACFRLTIPLN